MTHASGLEPILLVDDSESVHHIVRESLESLGHPICCVDNGCAALRWLEGRSASLVLLDYRLPDMSGKSVLEELTARGQDVALVVVTAYGDERIAVEMMKLGALDYLVKDEAFAEFLPSVVRRALEHQEGRRRHREAEAALRQSEERFRAIFENAAAGMATISPQGRLLQSNPALCRMFDRKPQELQGLSLQELTRPEDRERTLRRYEQLVQGERSSFDYEKGYLRGDGTVFWGHASVAGVYDDAGRLLYAVALVQDVSGRRSYQDLVSKIDRGVSLKTGVHFFRSLVYQLADVLEADLALVGERPPERPDSIRPIAAFGDGGEQMILDYPLSGSPCEAALNQGQVLLTEEMISRFSGHPLLAGKGISGCAAESLYDSADNPVGFLVVLFRRPILEAETVASVLRVFSLRAAAELERRRAERALRSSEKKYRKLSQEFQTLLNGIPDILLLLDRDFRVVWSNRAAQERVSGMPERMTDLSCRDICGAGEDACRECPVLRGFHSGRTEDAVLRLPEGTIWGVKVFPLPNGGGRVSRAIMVASDVTEKKRLQEEASRTARLAAVGEMAAGAAHEINNPMGLILMNIPAIGEVFNDALPVLEAHFEAHGEFTLGGMKYSRIKQQLPGLLEEVLEGARRVKHIVEDLKGFARDDRKDGARQFDLDEAAKKAVRLVRSQIKEATRKFACHWAAGLPPVRGNPQEIEQVVVNLLLNACQALPDRDRKVSIATRHDSAGARCQIIVRDEGRGIAPENLTHVTDPFFTTRREVGGTGLGLSVSARIVREHGGRLDFFSRVGEGTTVTVSLPAAPSKGARQ